MVNSSLKLCKASVNKKKIHTQTYDAGIIWNKPNTMAIFAGNLSLIGIVDNFFPVLLIKSCFCA